MNEWLKNFFSEEDERVLKSAFSAIERKKPVEDRLGIPPEKFAERVGWRFYTEYCFERERQGDSGPKSPRDGKARESFERFVADEKYYVGERGHYLSRGFVIMKIAVLGWEIMRRTYDKTRNYCLSENIRRDLRDVDFTLAG